MAGLIFLAVVLAWIALAVWLAHGLTKLTTAPFAKGLTYLVATPAIIVAPVADDFVGKQEFERLCASAESVHTLGTIPVGDPLYTASGEWRLATYPWSDHAAHSNAVKYADSLVRWDHGTHSRAPSFVPVQQRTVTIYAASTDRPLAQWTAYSFAGGFLRRNIWPSGSECLPLVMRQGGYGVYRQIMVYEPQAAKQ